MAFIGRIRKMLCFKTDGTSCWESCSMSTFETIVPVWSINLYTGLCSVYFHATTAFGLHTFAANSVCLLHVCLIHSSGHSRHRILAVRMGHWFYCLLFEEYEIHRSTFYFGNFACRDGYIIYRSIKSALMVTMLLSTVAVGLAMPDRLKNRGE